MNGSSLYNRGYIPQEHSKMVQAENGVEIGAVPQGIVTRQLNLDGGEWKDTPFFIAGIPDGAEHALPLKDGDKVAGKMITVRQTQDKKHHYVCMEDYKGNKFRVRAGKILKENLEGLASGTGVVLTYLGKKESTSTGNVFNDFKVEVIEGGLN
jgi:hypothetical protein